jgi:hypothetical protein
MHDVFRRGPAVAAFLAAAAATFLPATAAAHGKAHVHGQAELAIAAEGPQLEIVFEAPLDGLIGFEHAPRTDAQRAAVRDMAAKLRKSADLFRPTPDAGCSPASVRLASAVLAPELLGEAGGAKAGSSKDGHADLEAAYTFRCAAPGALKGLETTLRQVFPGLRKIDVRVATARGQRAFVLSGQRNAVAW